MSQPLRVLFVCTANICRSPFMELLTRHLAGVALDVSSAGTHGFDGRPMEPAMVRPLLQRGVAEDSVAGFGSRPLTTDLVSSSDVVLTAEAAHRRWILDDQPAAFRTVFTLGQFAAAVEEAEGATGLELLERVGARRPAADVALDVADPYRRGDVVAATCADQIEDLLRVVVPALTGSERISA